MKYGRKSSHAPAFQDSNYPSWLMWSGAHEAPQATVPGNLEQRSGFARGELARKFDQMAAELQKATTRRDQLEDELAEHIAAEATLARVNQQLEEFTYVASHDLQEPLRKIQMFCQWLEKDMGASPPAAARRDLAFIADGASRMQQLIRDLLTFSRLGRDGVKCAPLSLGQAVDQALANLAVSIGEKRARIERDPLPEVTGDIALLVELYQNLIGNALKYSEQRPEIRITAAREDGRWVFGVQDNGIGIDPAYAEQIFLPFKRLHGKGQYNGSGIGLAICRKVVEAHNGAIWVESNGARGTHFRFTLGDAG